MIRYTSKRIYKLNLMIHCKVSVSSSSQAIVGRPLVSVDNGAREYPSLTDRKECRCMLFCCCSDKE